MNVHTGSRVNVEDVWKQTDTRFMGSVLLQYAVRTRDMIIAVSVRKFLASNFMPRGNRKYDVNTSLLSIRLSHTAVN